MDLITPRELIDAFPLLKVLGGEPLARQIFRILKFDRINREYSLLYNLPARDFVAESLRIIGCKPEFPEEDLENIPRENGFITISNHAYGGLDGLILMKIIPDIRPDYKILVNFLLTKITPIREYFLGVNPFETYKDVKSSIGGLKDAFQHLAGGHPLGIYPAGEVSAYKFSRGTITDKEWQHSILRFIKKAQVPVIPIYFDGHNSNAFHLLGMIHPILRTAKLPSEMFNKQGKMIKVRIGQPIPVKEQDLFKDIGEYGKYLRMRTYNLGIPSQPKKKNYFIVRRTPEKIIDPVDPGLIREEIETIKKDYLLFNIKEDFVFCAPSTKIPGILKEIGRLREITFREVGEGTNKNIDLDEFDPFYEQLFIWDNVEQKIVGGYRAAKGDKTIERAGLKGLYISSLFRIDERFLPVLQVSIELGRSFVIRDYQKKALSLFLLWKGILYLLLKHPEYRYLIGPVSIPNAFTDLSKSLAVEFLKTNYFNSEFAGYITPAKSFSSLSSPSINKEIFHKYTEKDIGHLDNFIQDFDPQYRTPVLLKKYISVNAEVIGFNVDPKFNNCLDALMLLDLFEVPFSTIESLSKEFNDQSILDRFKK
jgi:putative hemolysin